MEQTRSSFITITSWVLIIFCGFGAVIGFMQVLFLVGNGGGFGSLAASPNDPFIFRHIEKIFFANFVVMLTTFTGAIAMLKRKNWGRLIVIGFFVLLLLWNLLGSIAIGYFLTTNTGFTAQFGSSGSLIMIFQCVFVLAFIGFIIWILKKLTSKAIKREFMKS